MYIVSQKHNKIKYTCTYTCTTRIALHFCVFYFFTPHNKAGKEEEVHKVQNCETVSFINNNKWLLFVYHTMTNVLMIRTVTKIMSHQGNISTIPSASLMCLEQCKSRKSYLSIYYRQTSVPSLAGDKT